MKITLVFCFHFSCYNGIDCFKYTGSPTTISPLTISGPPPISSPAATTTKSGPLILPEKAMKTNDIQEFHINKNINRECQLSPAKYFVKKDLKKGEKEEGQVEEVMFVFYVARYEAVIETRVSTASPDFPTTGGANIGTAECRNGIIDYVYVRQLARRCGIAKVLSALCMLDPEIYSMEEGNTALKMLNRHSEQEHAVSLKKCLRLVALENEADPYAGAFAYLKAAQHSGLQYLVVHRDSVQYLNPKIKKDCHDKFLPPYEVNHILTANLFKGNTGLIEDIAGSGRGAMWYFCRR